MVGDQSEGVDDERLEDIKRFYEQEGGMTPRWMNFIHRLIGLEPSLDQSEDDHE